MRCLLDTHVFIWMDLRDPRIPRTVAALLADPSAELLVSHVSIWELAIKAGIGKFRPRTPLPLLVDLYMRSGNIRFLPISMHHVLAVQHLPRHHGDPFDRLIAAQALAEGLPLLTADAVFARYGVERVWD